MRWKFGPSFMTLRSTAGCAGLHAHMGVGGGPRRSCFHLAVECLPARFNACAAGLGRLLGIGSLGPDGSTALGRIIDMRDTCFGRAGLLLLLAASARANISLTLNG